MPVKQVRERTVFLKLCVYYAADNPNFAPLSEPLICSISGLFEIFFYTPSIQISFIIALSLTETVGNKSAPMQLAHCRFPGLAISNSKILTHF